MYLTISIFATGGRKIIWEEKHKVLSHGRQTEFIILYVMISKYFIRWVLYGCRALTCKRKCLVRDLDFFPRNSKHLSFKKNSECMASRSKYGHQSLWFVQIGLSGCLKSWCPKIDSSHT